MNNDEKINSPVEHILMIVYGDIIKRSLGGTTEAAERLALKLIYIMDNNNE